MTPASVIVVQCKSPEEKAVVSGALGDWLVRQQQQRQQRRVARVQARLAAKGSLEAALADSLFEKVAQASGARATAAQLAALGRAEAEGREKAAEARGWKETAKRLDAEVEKERAAAAERGREWDAWRERKEKEVDALKQRIDILKRKEEGAVVAAAAATTTTTTTTAPSRARTLTQTIADLARRSFH